MDWLSILTPEAIERAFDAAMSHEVIKFGIAFSLAAWIHAGRVKKEIAKQAAGIQTAFNNLATAIKQDLKDHSERIGRTENGMSKLEERIEKLEVVAWR